MSEIYINFELLDGVKALSTLATKKQTPVQNSIVVECAKVLLANEAKRERIAEGPDQNSV
jgi:hypothetical protein